MNCESQCSKERSEINPMIVFFKWFYRFCRSIQLSREYSIKEYAGFVFGAISLTSLIVYGFAFASATFATQVSSDANWLMQPSKTGPLGDTIGGLSAPLIGVIAAAMSFLSFFMQYRANLSATKQFENTSSSDDKDRFDRRLESLILQNREISRNMRIGNQTSEKTINSLCKELRLAIETVREKVGDRLTNSEVINIGYAFFYIGIGPTSNSLIRDLFPDPNITGPIISKLNKLQQDWETNLLMVKHRCPPMDGDLYEIPFFPFDGHQTLLGHYFRSYYHVLKFAKDNHVGLFDFGQVYEKIKSLRTQTSVYEQILILTNSQTIFGAELADNGMIKDFRLTKNIPTPLISFLGEYRDPLEGKHHEWQKITERQRIMYPTKVVA